MLEVMETFGKVVVWYLVQVNNVAQDVALGSCEIAKFMVDSFTYWSTYMTYLAVAIVTPDKLFRRIEENFMMRKVKFNESKQNRTNTP